MVAPDSQLCSALNNQSVFNFLISLALAFGIVFSYLPQHLRIISRKSSRGISPWYLLLGMTSGTCSLGNVLLLSADVMGCCKVLSGKLCFAATLGVIQIALQFSMFAIILVLFVVYFPREHTAEYRLAVNVGAVAIVHFLITFLLALIVFISGKHIRLYAGFLGIEATLLTAFQYIPQLYMTFKLRHAESLSMHTLMIQAPGGFVWALTLALRQGTSWSSWLPYFISATLQTCLLSMCVYFDYKHRFAGQFYDPLVPEMEDEEYTISIFHEDAEHAD
ncbi:hypothetical protein V1525DRAFT_395501 [Lipomyces kononenkoae]|uniref:Uncharacterized protein n=1 Tax=Lipomyces kononenkoae TaxID=34357 RepID=A0ACC3T8J4_LIPKO